MFKDAVWILIVVVAAVVFFSSQYRFGTCFPANNRLTDC